MTYWSNPFTTRVNNFLPLISTQVLGFAPLARFAVNSNCGIQVNAKTSET